MLLRIVMFIATVFYLTGTNFHNNPACTCTWLYLALQMAAAHVNHHPDQGPKSHSLTIKVLPLTCYQQSIIFCIMHFILLCSEGELAEPAEPEVKEMTLDEWKAAQAGARTRPIQFNVRRAGEGEDQTQWKKTVALEPRKRTESTDESYEEEHDEMSSNKVCRDVKRGATVATDYKYTQTGF